MSDHATPSPTVTERDFERQLRETNDALLVSLVHQDEMLEQAEKSEISLREAKERYRILFDLGPMAIYSCNASGVIQEFNRRAAELWGRTPVLGDTNERFCGSFKTIRADGSVLAHDQCPMADVLSGKIDGARDAEVMIERPDGSRVNVIVNIRPLKNERGEITGAINCFYDITERRAAEETRTTLAAIVDSSDDAIISKDLNGVITSWNKGAERLFGYTAEETIGRSITMLVPPDLFDEETKIREQLRRGELIDHFETIRVRKDGSGVNISLTISPIKDSGGRIVGASKVARDISRRKTNEKALHDYAQQLRESDRHKTEFLAMLAHELRNPLAPISNCLQILRLTKGKEQDIQAAADVIESQVGQLVRLVDDLLDVSRISRGKIELRRGRVELASSIHHAVAAAQPNYDNTERVLTVTLPPQPIYLNADSARLTQLVGNLLNNACKFTDKGGRVWLTVEREGAQAVIRVRDNGIGIAADQLVRIFEMFTQVDTSLERSVSGLGIGLMLVKTLAEMHSGTVEVQSAGLGQGSEFIVRLPILIETSKPSPSRTTSEPLTTIARRILVIDDNRLSAQSLATLLQMTGTRHARPTTASRQLKRQRRSIQKWSCSTSACRN